MGRGTAGVCALQMAQFRVKLRIGDCIGVGALQLIERGHNRLRHEAPAELAEITALVGQISDIGTDIKFSHK